MTLRSVSAVAAAMLTLGACGAEIEDKTVDDGEFWGTDVKDLSQLVAGIWVSPNGCDYWIIDDGVEGYLSQRFDRYGKPVCSGVAPPNTATGPFKEGSSVPDPL